MICRNQRLDVDQAYKSSLGGSLAAHSILVPPTYAEIEGFSAACQAVTWSVAMVSRSVAIAGNSGAAYDVARSVDESADD